jgi:hypothetical protein
MAGGDSPPGRFLRRAVGVIGTRIKRIVVVMVGLAAAASLAGCALGPRPLSIEEKIWFDMATGDELLPPYRPYFHYYAPYAPHDYGPVPAPGYRY